MADATGGGELSAFMGYWLPQIEAEMRGVLDTPAMNSSRRTTTSCATTLAGRIENFVP